MAKGTRKGPGWALGPREGGWQSLLGARGAGGGGGGVCSYLSGFEVSHFLPPRAEAGSGGVRGKTSKNSQAPD